MRSILKKMVTQRLVVFGTGTVSELLSESLLLEVEYYVDNNRVRRGEIFRDREIKTPEFLSNEDREQLFILIASSAVDEIARQLNDMGFVESVHYGDGYALLLQLTPLQKFLPGHYYSPINAPAEIIQERERIFGQVPDALPGIPLNEDKQIDLLSEFRPYIHQGMFAVHKEETRRYYSDNGYYSYGDAVFLHCMMMTLRPQNIVEVGSGFSSSVILDSNEQFFNNEINCTFIEPYPERLLSLVKDEPIQLIRDKVQHVDIKLFESLSAGDILFIDSSHVGKTGSDLNYILFTVLPALKSGVSIHFHDIFYPFEYPELMVMDGVSWNEAYMVRAFLQYNEAFEIIAWNHYLLTKHQEKLSDAIPEYASSPGYSLWIRKK